MENKVNILYVDDEPDNSYMFLTHFRSQKNCEVYTCRSGEEGLGILNTTPIDIIITGQGMPDMKGVDFLQDSFPNNQKEMVVVVTAHRDNATLELALREGKIFTYKEHPWDIKDLERSIEETYSSLLRKKKCLNKLIILKLSDLILVSLI